MKKTKISFELVDATSEQISDVLQFITLLGDVVTTFNVDSKDIKDVPPGPTKRGENGRYLYPSDDAVDKHNTDPASNPIETVDRVNIQPKVETIGVIENAPSIIGDVKPYDLKNYL